MFDDMRVKEKVCFYRTTTKGLVADCVLLFSKCQELRCREEELRKAMLQQKIQEEQLKKREQVTRPLILVHHSPLVH